MFYRAFLLMIFLICLGKLELAASAYSKDGISDRWAVIVGVDKFKDKRVKPLKGASLNAIGLNDFLVARGGYKQDQIKLLVNEKATRTKIWESIGPKGLGKFVKPNDLVVVYMSTTLSEDSIEQKKKSYLLGFDADSKNLKSTGIPIESFANDLKEKLKCNRLIVILDTDFSGKAELNIEALPKKSFASSSTCGVMILCSCARFEKTRLSESREGTLFTNYFIDVIADGDYDLPIIDAFRTTTKKLQTRLKEKGRTIQMPVIKAYWRGEIPSIQPPISD